MNEPNMIWNMFFSYDIIIGFTQFVADKPGKPGTPQVDELQADRVGLSWKPPKQDGGSAITNYIVEYRIEGTFQWKQTRESITSASHTVRSLKTGETYEFRVYAENKAGVGPASDCTKPTSVQASIGKLLFCLNL